MAKKIDAVKESIYDKFGRKGELAFNNVDARQVVIENLYTRILTELCANRFEWHGLPDTISQRQIELCLVESGLTVVYYDENYPGPMAFTGSASGYHNIQREPVSYVITAPTYGSKTVLAADCVPIWANYLRIPDLDVITIYAARLAEIDRTIEINVRNSRRTRIVAVPETMRLSAKNINQRIDAGDAVIEINDQFAINEAFQTLDLGVDPNTIEKLHILKMRIWGECMSLLGLDYNINEKRGTMITPEVESNQEQLDSMKAVNLHSRQVGAERMNELYGCKVSVDYTTNRVNPIVSSLMDAVNIGGLENGDIYN